MLELGDVRRRVSELEVAAFAEVAVDRLLGDEPFHQLVGVERLAVERLARLLTVALDQLPGAPLVAGMDDAAVPRGGAPAQRVRLEEGDGDPAPGQLPGRVDPRVAATDHDDVGRVRQLAPGPIRKRRHRCLPERAALEVVVQGSWGGHGGGA